MTEISHQESSRLAVQDEPMSGSESRKTKAKRRDWFFGFLFVLAVIALIVALTAAFQLLLPVVDPAASQRYQLIPGFDQQTLLLPALYLPYVELSVPSSTISWPIGLQTGHFVLLSSLILALLLFILARVRIVRNRSMWPSTGCPSCQERELFRVFRSRRDHLISSIGIPVARYQCLECEWQGRRIHRGPKPASPWSIRSTGEGAAEPNRSPGKSEATQLPTPTTSRSENALLLGDTPSVQDGDDIGSVSRCEVSTPLGLNLRADPNSDGELIGTLEPGTVVELPGGVKEEDGVTWCQVQVNDQTGWVLSQFLKPLQ